MGAHQIKKKEMFADIHVEGNLGGADETNIIEETILVVNEKPNSNTLLLLYVSKCEFLAVTLSSDLSWHSNPKIVKMACQQLLF